jgi:hypothetical protein
MGIKFLELAMVGNNNTITNHSECVFQTTKKITMNIESIQTIQTVANILGWFFLIASWVVPSFFKQNKVRGYELGVTFAVTSIAFLMVALGIGLYTALNN